ncbi:MAG: penicillin-binding protein 2 [Verrucomicrobiae bacterium]|nr:penicillin-binding protein 2 [Verrucomicrobiae bacterium]
MIFKIDIFKSAESRIRAMRYVMLAGVGILIFSLWRTQISDNESYTKAMVDQSLRDQHLPSARGMILDRNGLVLADNQPGYNLELYLKEIVRSYPQKIPYIYNKKNRKVEDIKTIVGQKIPVLLNKLDLPKDVIPMHSLEKHFDQEPFQPFKVKINVTPELKARFFENSPIISGVDISVEAVRSYPMGPLAAHLLGYVGRPENREDMTGFLPSFVGKQGLEKTMDEYLVGQEGQRVIRVNTRGFIEGEVRRMPPIQGNSVFLAIDVRIQQIVENALKDVGRGAAVVVDIHNGDIVAMASIPSFDPNAYIPAISQKELTRLYNDPDSPLLNRAVSSYAPGSIFKPVIALAALEKGVIKPSDTLDCASGIQLGNHFFKCWKAPDSHGSIPMKTAIAISCNGYFYRLGIKAGPEAISQTAAKLGLGMRTDSQVESESDGVIPNREWMKIRYPRERWTDAYTANTSIGQGYVKVTPLQMAMMTATIANGGTLYEPRIVDKITDEEGRIVFDNPPQVRWETGFKLQNLNAVREGMLAVIEEGTGGNARQKDMKIGGKTGSAQFNRRLASGELVKDTRTWFITFAPYENTRYAMCVLVEGGVSGGSTCAPVAGKIWRQIFSLPALQPGEAPAPVDQAFLSDTQQQESAALADPNALVPADPNAVPGADVTSTYATPAEVVSGDAPSERVRPKIRMQGVRGLRIYSDDAEGAD